MSGGAWWSGGLYFSCLGCGRCCAESPGTVRFTADEELAMANLLMVSASEFRARYVWRRYGKPSLRERANYDCVFLSPSARCCVVYGVHPAQCREFPFWPEVLSSRESWDRFALSCVGMNQGNFHDSAEISARLQRQLDAPKNSCQLRHDR